MSTEEFKQLFLKLQQATPAKSLPGVVKRNAALWAHIVATTSQYTDLAASERIYIWLHNCDPICTAGNKRSFNTLEKGYREFCGPRNACECSKQAHSRRLKDNWATQSDSAKQQRLERMQRTSLDKYGVSNPVQSQLVQAKLRATNQQRYGVDYAVAAPQVQAKARATNRRRYGVDTPLESAEIRGKGLATQLQNSGGLMVAARRASYEKFNGNPFAHPDVQAKIRSTVTKRYNRKYFKQSHLTEKVAETLLNKHLFTAACGGYTIAEAAVLLGVAESTIARAAKRLGAADCLAVSNRSKWEFILTNWLTQTIGLTEGVDFVRNTKTVIAPLELDFYFPEHNLAVEVGAIFWHSENNGKRDRHYHHRKWRACDQQGITLLQYWDDELTDSLPLVLNKIAYLLGCVQLKKIGARQTSLCSISTEQEREFLEQYHIQGYTPDRSVVLGAYYCNTLVGVLCAAKRKHGWEIVRYATHSDYQIVGLFTRMLSNSGLSGMVYSFSDNRHGNGKLYRSAGFTHVSTIEPSYSYTEDYHSRLHRRNWSKAILAKKGLHVNHTLTEWENMQALGYDRIWDCGKKKWAITL